jgi:hypothetical protein
MKLAGTLQGLVVVVLVVAVTTCFLNRIDFMIVLTGTLAFVVIAVVTPLITVFQWSQLSLRRSQRSRLSF